MPRSDLRVAPSSQTPATSWHTAWSARVWLARVVAAVLTMSRLVLVLAGIWLLARFLVHPHSRPGLVVAWFLLSLLGLALLEVTDRASRRLFPLVALLRLGVAFPDVAPSRFRTALRAGSTRALTRSSRRLALPVEGVAPAAAAAALLELVGALGAHDSATRGHSERVRAYTELLAEELGIPRTERHQLRWGGLVHDIGKVRVPRAVLNKRSALNDDEWEMIRRHPLDGLALAAPLRPWLGDAILAVSDHHERWDGGGYPSGAAGNDIALSGRIVAVADAFDVMTSARSYKRPVSPDAARAELVACAGTQFDPDVVRAFLSISIPRLRPILGPLASIQAAVQVQWHVLRHPLPRRLLAALVITAITYIGGAFTITDPEPGTGSSQPRTPSESGSPRGGETAIVSAQDPPLPAHEQTGRRAPRTGNPVAPRTVAQPQPQPDRPDETTRTNPPPTARPPAPHPGSGGGIVIDPSTGSVAIFPPGTVPVDAPPVVIVPLVGSTACGVLNVCTPIVIELPGLLPPM